MESMTTPDDSLLQRMETTSQTSGSNPLVPQLNASVHQDLASLRETFVDTLWQGLMFYQPENVQLPLRCTISSRVTSKEKLCADKWPKLLRLQLLPRLSESPFSSIIQSDPHCVMIQFSKVSEASLCNILRPGLVGHVLLSSTSIEATRIMFITCLPESGIFLGSFFDLLIQEMEMQPLLRPVMNNSKIQMTASMPISQQHVQDPQQAKLLQQSIAKDRQALIALFTKAIDVANGHFTVTALEATHERRMRQLRTKPYCKSKPKRSGASCTTGPTNSIVLSSKVRDCLKSSVAPEVREMFYNYIFRKKMAERKCPQTIEELYDGIWKHVETRVKSCGSTTKDEAIEELMGKLNKCSVLQSSNE